jgi:hypothetical protein
MLNKILSLFNKKNDTQSESQEERKPSSKIVDGRIHYEFKCGLKAYQEEMNLEQDQSLAEIILGFDLKSFSLETTSIKDLVDIILKEKALNKILDIILFRSDGSSDCFDLLKNSELQIIFEDFFSLNPTVKDWLMTSGSGLTLLFQILSTENSSKQ